MSTQFLFVLAVTLLSGSAALWLACRPAEQQEAAKNPNMTAMFNALLMAFTSGIVTLFILVG